MNNTYETWQIDNAHSGIQFSVRHLVIAKVRGQFTSWNGSLSVPDGDFDRALVDVTIDAASIDTRVAARDAHLRSVDFFDVETYPEITFKGTRVDKLGDERLSLTGELTMRGVTKEVNLEVELAGRTQDSSGNELAVFSAKTSVDRREFGLTWNQALETGGVMVGDKVEIEIEIEAVRQEMAQVA